MLINGRRKNIEPIKALVEPYKLVYFLLVSRIVKLIDQLKFDTRTS